MREHAKVGGTPTNLVTVSANSPIHFAAVSFDIGNAFDSTLGVFTAPVSGVYIFTFQIFTNFDGDTLIDLMKNGHIEALMRLHSQSYEDSEASSMAQRAVAGDKFWVQINHSGKLEFGPHSFFSGALLSPDE
nr:hypothetical protein BaRGS_024890 [Batillaria attramentaria]